MENIEIYYESIKQVYNEITKWENSPKPFRQRLTNFLIGFTGVIFGLSIIPILPSVLVYIGTQFGWIIGGFNLGQSTIWTYALAWLIFTVGSIFLFIGMFWLDDKINPFEAIEKRKAPQTLSAEQLTFIFVYGAFKELRIFFVSRIDQHVRNSLEWLEKFQDNGDLYRDELLRQEMRYPADVEMVYKQRVIFDRKKQPSLIRQVSVAREFLQTFGKYPWFQIDEETKARLQALISFQKKILIRLQKREDLPAVLAILENLSKFFYAFLPEHQTNMEEENLAKLQAEGILALDKFVNDVTKLIEYPVEQKPSKRDKSDHPRVSQRLQAFYLNNVFFRFTIWLILLLVITSGLVFLVSLRLPNLDVNIMVSMIIATSITGAAALAVLSPKGSVISKSLDNHERIDDETAFERETTEENRS